MKKIIYSIVLISVIIVGIIVSIYMMNKTINKQQESKIENINMSEKVTDECIDEYIELETVEQEVEEANSDEEEKVSPNAVITFEKYYKECEHTVKRYEKIPSNLVNATRQQIEDEYENWILKDFSKDKIILYKEEKGLCGEHYMLRDVNGKINIYSLDENGEETLLNKTDIATEYLTETDMINMENGLIVYGKENLNQLLEDFE